MRKIIYALGMVGFLFFSAPASAVETAYVDVNGLVCDFCARALEAVFGEEEAVENVNVNLDTKVITVNFKDDMRLKNEKITQLIEDSGYNVVAIRDTEASSNE